MECSNLTRFWQYIQASCITQGSAINVSTISTSEDINMMRGHYIYLSNTPADKNYDNYLMSDNFDNIYLNGRNSINIEAGNLGYINIGTVNTGHVVLGNSTSGITMAGDIIPTGSGSINLGSPSHHFKRAYVDEFVIYGFVQDPDTILTIGDNTGTSGLNLRSGSSGIKLDCTTGYIEPYGDIIPNVNSTYKLGSPTKHFSDIYVDDGFFDLFFCILPCAENRMDPSIGTTLRNVLDKINDIRIKGLVGKASDGQELLTYDVKSCLRDLFSGFHVFM